MDFIYDQSPGFAEHRAAAVTGEQQIERFGSSDNYVRRPSRHLCAFSRRSIAGPHQGSNFKLRESRRPKLRLYPRQWLLQVALDVIAQSFQRGYVDHLSGVFKFPIDTLT